MRMSFKNLLPWSLSVVLGILLTAQRSAAQTFSDVISLAGGSAGANPDAPVLLSSNILYGTTAYGGAASDGTVFAVNINGTGYTNVHSFSSSDGANPEAGLVLVGNTLYGTTLNGGASGDGTVFSVKIDGSGFSNLYAFSGSDGANPQAGLIVSGNTLYGTTVGGGSYGSGAVFSVNTDGTGFSNLYSFTYSSDGAAPAAPLILSGGTLYGTAQYGGFGYGTVFSVNTDGTGFNTIYSFTNGNDGGGPLGGLVLAGNTLFGTTENGGAYNWGTIFAVNIDSTGFTNLYGFTGAADGGHPEAGLVLEGNVLYGTAQYNSITGDGAVFSVETNGLNFTPLFAFPGYSQGVNPQAGLITAGLTLYGTTYNGGSSTVGTVFSLVLPCPNITLAPGAAPGGRETVNYNQSITPTGGLAPFTFNVTAGSLPGGITLTSNGVLSGIPTSTGDFSFTVTATDANGCSASNAYSINVDTSPFADLHDFTTPGGPASTNLEGYYPNGVILSGGTLYGTAQFGGAFGDGAVYAVGATGVTNLHSFTLTSSSNYYTGTNLDGTDPVSELVLAGDTLYGTAQYGGAFGNGSIFAVNVDGTGFRTVHSFSDDSAGTNGDGAYPASSLIIAGGTIYGTAPAGGLYSSGTVFSVNTNGLHFTNLYDFTGGNDGANPEAGVTLAGNTLFGTTAYGGLNGAGAVFSITTNGAGFSNVYNFSAPSLNESDLQTNSDGAFPAAPLVLAGNTLFGTAPYGGVWGDGTVFSVDLDGSNFTTLYTFSAVNTNQYYQETNFDGATPVGGLTLAGGTLYGSAEAGGFNGDGAVFAVETNGNGFATLYYFDGYNGESPNDVLTFSGNTLYGTATYGGFFGLGLIFNLSTCPAMTLSPSTVPGGNIGVSYSQTFATVGGTPPYTYAVTGGALPGGLSLSPAGVLSGSPTNIGTFNFDVTGADANGCSAMNSYAMTILAHFTLLHGFAALTPEQYSSSTNVDGANPYAGLVLSGSSLYGVATGGGAYGYGTVFSVGTSGSNFSVLHTFEYSDGETPSGTLALSGSTLYGPTQFGGRYENGVLFAINNDGTGFSNMYQFTGQNDGFEPAGRLVFSSNTLYGADRGGSAGVGTVYKVTTGGSNFTTLHPFTGTGSDGTDSPGGFVLSGNMIYGTAGNGTAHDGMIFAVTANGTGFTNLHNFTGASDGSGPNGDLILSGSTLYGTASSGGSAGHGTIFSMNTNGSNFTVLYNFTEGGLLAIGPNEYITNSDGAYPTAGLAISGDTLYGVAADGGLYGFGTAFAINTNGSNFVILYDFTDGADGGFPSAPLLVVGNTLYGTAASGGNSNSGTIFALGLAGANTAVPPTVTWTNVAPLTYGAGLGSNQLNAAANVPGNFAYAPTPGTVFSNIGTYPLTVVFSPTDTADYTSVTDTVNVVVTPAPLTVTANNATRRRDSLNPTFTGTITGLVNGDNISASYSTTAAYGSLPGTYPIIPALADPNHRATNYTVTLIDATLTITPIVAIFDTLHDFGSVASQRPTTNSDGAGPIAGLILSGIRLYGAASFGGTGGTGNIFAINKDGTDFTNIYNFLPYTSGCCGFFQNADGMSPEGTLALSSNVLYGPTENGGNGYVGALFEVETNGLEFTNLHQFQNVSFNNQNFPVNGDGANPYAGLILSNGILYGTSIYGGTQGTGVVFALTDDGSSFATLHDFGTNDGVGIFAGLVLAGDTLYGAAQGGGTNGGGTLFAININTMAFSILHSFTPATDGAGPDGTLLLVSNTLYGTTGTGGSGGEGTVFSISTNGSNFSVMYNFSALTNSTNFDGAKPLAGLILSSDGTVLYGTAVNGGAFGAGTVFAIGTNGMGFTNLYSFTGGVDGAYPESALVLSDYTLFGTAAEGGSSGNGTIYSLTCLPPSLNIYVVQSIQQLSGIVLTWPASLEGFSYAGYTLQSTTNLATTPWTNVVVTPSLVNGQYSVVVPFPPTQEFFRLYEHLNQ